jgi:hypothetical protein
MIKTGNLLCNAKQLTLSYFFSESALLFQLLLSRKFVNCINYNASRTALSLYADFVHIAFPEISLVFFNQGCLKNDEEQNFVQFLTVTNTKEKV